MMNNPLAVSVPKIKPGRMRRMFKAFTIGLCVLAAGVGTAGAQEKPWPTQVVRLIVPYAAGGGVDRATRIVADKLSTAFGQQFIVENRAGGSTIIAAETVAKSQPDGYTFLIPVPATFTVNPSLFKKLPYSVSDFEPVSLIGKIPLFVTVGEQTKFRSVKDLVAQARSNAVTYASAGNGSMTQLGAELIKLSTGSQFLHVPYKGTSATIPDVAAGRIEFTLVDLGAAKGMIDAGRMKVLATTSASRSSLLPSAPSMKDEGIDGVDVSTWIGLAAPKGTSKGIITRLSTEVGRILADPTVKNQLAQVGMEAAPLPPEAFAKMIAEESAKWKTVIQKANITAD